MSAYLHKVKWTVSAGFLTCCAALAEPATAQEMTAGSVLTKLSPDERVIYLAGIAEGLAYARYQRDNTATDGMACIYRWFYAEGTVQKIESAFGHFPDHTPGAVMMAMAEKECGG